jgi:hypothetical protein
MGPSRRRLPLHPNARRVTPLSVIDHYLFLAPLAHCGMPNQGRTTKLRQPCMVFLDGVWTLVAVRT